MKRLGLIIGLFFAACHSKQADTIHMAIAGNSIKVTGVPNITLRGMERDSMPIQAWQSLLQVYRMPADTEMKNYQPITPGNYRVSANAVVFTPDTAFLKGHTYFARYFHYDKAITAMDLVLQRRTLGRGTYIELVFKY